MNEMIMNLQQTFSTITVLDRVLLIVGTLCFATLMLMLLNRKPK